MTYEAPPLSTSLHIVCNIAPANATLLAAPSAGFAYRIVGLWAMAEKGNTAGAILEVHFQDTAHGAGGPDLWGAALCASAGSGWAAYSLPEPGLLLGPTDILNVFFGSSVNTQGCDVGVYYFVDGF